MEKRSREKLIVILAILLFLSLLCFFINIFDLFNLKKVQAVSATYDLEVPEILINKNPINIDEILLENKNISIREEMIYEEQELEYTTQYIKNEELPSGTIHISQVGSSGISDVITIKKFDGDSLISEKIVANNVRKTPINKIVEIGVGKRKE